MARSILPSRWRGASSARAVLHRSERHAVSVAMRQLERDPESWADETASAFTCDHEITQLVRDRRNADKLAHFERWAVKKTRALPLDQRLGAMRSVLPPGLIGEHALSHLKHREEFSLELRRDWRAGRIARWLDRGEVTELLRRALVTPGAHRLFHLALRAALSPPPQQGERLGVPDAFRPLEGTHDLRDFLDRVFTARGPLHTAVDSWCRAFKAHHFDPEATARAYAPLAPWLRSLSAG